MNINANDSWGRICRHSSRRLSFRDYDGMPAEARAALREAVLDWCPRCLVKDVPGFLIADAVAEADAEAIRQNLYVV